MASKQVVTLAVTISEEDTPLGKQKVRRVATSLEAIVIEAMGMTGRRGFSVTLEVASLDEVLTVPKDPPSD